jgi:hypothetical protein
MIIVLLFLSCVHYVLLLHGVMLLMHGVHHIVVALCSSCYFVTWCSLCFCVASHFVIGIKIIKTNDERIILSLN